jgi:hypothetical protein
MAPVALAKESLCTAGIAPFKREETKPFGSIHGNSVPSFTSGGQSDRLAEGGFSSRNITSGIGFKPQFESRARSFVSHDRRGWGGNSGCRWWRWGGLICWCGGRWCGGRWCWYRWRDDNGLGPNLRSALGSCLTKGKTANDGGSTREKVKLRFRNGQLSLSSSCCDNTLAPQ